MIEDMMSVRVDAHDSNDARRNSTSSNNEYEQAVFERYIYDDNKKQFQFILNVMKEITKRTTFNVPTFNPEAAKVVFLDRNSTKIDLKQ